MIPRRILVPVTLARETAEVAAGMAALAAAVRAELLLLGVAPPTREPPDQQRTLEQLVARQLEELADVVPSAAAARILFTRGPVAPALVAVAHERRADLVALPVRTNNVAANVYLMRHVAVPLLLVPADARP